nr:MAG TPA: hypothetical protein [Caudoviricetes sp.]
MTSILSSQRGLIELLVRQSFFKCTLWITKNLLTIGGAIVKRCRTRLTVRYITIVPVA